MIWNIKKSKHATGMASQALSTQVTLNTEVRCLFRDLGVLGNFTPAELWGYNPALLVTIWVFKDIPCI